MRSCFVLLFASLLTSCEAQGTIETPVFVLKGRDLLLKLHDDPPEGVLFVEWKFNKTVTLVRFEPSGKATVTERFELGGNKFSVILKNLQEADSGVYSAVAGTSTVDKLLAEYKVTVQGPVSPVELIVDRVDSSSSESCDLHVTCRTHHSHISSTFRCVDRTCSQEGGEQSEVTTSGASLQVYLLNNVIICDHRNKVHWTQDLIHAEHLCPSKPDPPSGWMIATCILIAFMFVGLIVWLHRQRRRISDGRRLIEHIQNAAQKSELHRMLTIADAPEIRREFKDLVRKVLLEFTSAPRQDERPEDPDSEIRREFKDLVRKVLLRITSAPRQDESPADPDSDLRRRFEDLVSSVILRLTSEPPQMLSPADASGVGRRFKVLVHEALLRAALHQVFRPEDINPDLGKRFENLVSSVLQEFTSAPRQDESPEDPDSGVGRRFEDLVSSVILRSTPDQKLSPADDSDLGRRFENLVSSVLQEELKRQFLDHLNKKKASREKMAKLARQLLDELNKKVPSREEMEELERLLLDHLTKKAALGEEMTNLELQLLDHLNKKKASGEKMMAELELLNVRPASPPAL
ncbi:uncharacterized protein LOC119207491 isoform X1 [Pungitius pungitius]|uniref:uncharacterized protein LOC119207491 isoform X1 n=1 Tax=Pungitius pungitius TaxID=134920 RepID=UPI002E11DC4E